MSGHSERLVSMSAVQDVVLSVPDVSCEHCVKTINTSLGKISGIENVITDIPTKTVHVRYNPDLVSMREIENTLDEEGYTIDKQLP